MKIDLLNPIKIFKPEKIRHSMINISPRIPELPYDRFDFSSGVVKSIEGIVNAICGTFSKEDLLKINKYTKNFTDTTELSKEKLSTTLKVEKMIKDLFQQAKDCDEDLIFIPQVVSRQTKEKIRENLLKLYAIKTVTNKERKFVSPIPFNLLFDTKLGIQNTNFPHSLFLHPRDKAVNLTGILVKEDYEKIKEYETKFAKLSTKKQLKKKENVLKDLNKMLLRPEADFIGAFSEKQLGKLRELVIKYDALNNIDTKNTTTKKLETILYRTKLPKDIKIGSYINGLGLVVNRIDINTSDGTKFPAIILFSNKNAFNSFRVYDLQKLNNITSQKEEKSALISEIEFKLTPNNTYFVRNFRNFDTRSYPDAGKIVGIQLIKLFIEKDLKPIEFEALAFAESKRSPVNYYRRFGFKPLSHTQEEIEKILKENNGRFPYDIPVKMYLDDLKTMRKRILSIEKKTLDK